jgi:hypothetical protein
MIDDGLTSTEALAIAGYTHREDPQHPHRMSHLIERNGRVVARLAAYEVWRWLERRAAKLAALDATANDESRM